MQAACAAAVSNFIICEVQVLSVSDYEEDTKHDHFFAAAESEKVNQPLLIDSGQVGSGRVTLIHALVVINMLEWEALSGGRCSGLPPAL